MSHSTNTNTNSGFGHQRLDAYHVALELFVEVEAVAAAFPKGYADLKDQLRRATSSIGRNIAEGANRAHPRDKAARFMVARGECGECDATLEMAQLLELIPWSIAAKLRRKVDRVAAMTWGLVRREQARVGP